MSREPPTSRATSPGGPHASRPPAASFLDAASQGGKTDKERFANPTDPDSRRLRARNRFLQGYNAQAAVSTDQVIVGAEVTNAAHGSTMFVPMVRASEDNLALADADDIGTFVADTGYWNVENVTIATPSKVLITPMPATKGITEPGDPRIEERSKVLSRIAAGELSVKRAALEMGVSYNWARQLLDDYQVGRGDPAVLRKQKPAEQGLPRASC